MGHPTDGTEPVHPRIQFALLALTLAAAALSASAPAMAGAGPATAQNQAQPDRSAGVQRDAGVPDETHVQTRTAGQAARSASPVTPLPPPYGPVLRPRVPGSATSANPAASEVPDETDGQTPAAAPAPPEPQPQTQQHPRQPRHHPQRRPAVQPPGPMAPRPLDGGPAGATASPVPLPRLAAPTQSVVPNSTLAGPCQGGVCTDAGGPTTSGNGAAGIGAGGRLCVRSAATVQCF